jgi:hypothetical protein
LLYQFESDAAGQPRSRRLLPGGAHAGCLAGSVPRRPGPPCQRRKTARRRIPAVGSEPSRAGPAELPRAAPERLRCSPPGSRSRAWPPSTKWCRAVGAYDSRTSRSPTVNSMNRGAPRIYKAHIPMGSGVFTATYYLEILVRIDRRPETVWRYTSRASKRRRPAFFLPPSAAPAGTYYNPR